MAELRFFLAAVLIAVVSTAKASNESPVPPALSVYAGPAAPPIMEQHTVCADCAPFAHAASLVHTGGTLRAFWYAGSKEAHYDVGIYSATFDGVTWSAASRVTDRIETGRQLGRFVKTVGNPVAFVTSDGTLRLIYVAVSMRGWATTYLVSKDSTDGGRSWTEARRLISSPLLNISTMTKTAPLPLGDGSVWVPAYWTLGTTYPVMLRLDGKGTVSGLSRMAPRGVGLQPAVSLLDDGTYLALYRRLPRAQDHLKGAFGSSMQDWSSAQRTGFANPGSPVSLVKLPDGTQALFLNEKSEEALGVALTADGKQWSQVIPLPLEDSAGKAYPYAIVDPSGVIDLVYSCRNYSTICHVQTSAAWLKRQVQHRVAQP